MQMARIEVVNLITLRMFSCRYFEPKYWEKMLQYCRQLLCRLSIFFLASELLKNPFRWLVFFYFVSRSRLSRLSGCLVVSFFPANATLNVCCRILSHSGSGAAGHGGSLAMTEVNSKRLTPSGGRAFTVAYVFSAQFRR